MLPKREKLQFPVGAELSGTLHQRAERLWARLHDDAAYGRVQAFRPADYAWPGDFEGRLLLARTLLGNFLNRDSAEALWMLENYSCHANSGGYLGHALTDCADEQQLAGHGWLLRAFSEAQLRRPELDLKPTVQTIFANLICPLKEFLPVYPLTVGERTHGGAVDGMIDRKLGKWLVSTDVGCVFILLDGLVQATQVFGLESRAILDLLVNLASRMDFTQVRAQTHATLTLARGLMRYAEYFDKPEVLLQVRAIYDLYRRSAMTENYANFNWFGRPEWTEPCAIIDSFMVAMALFRATGEAHYLSDAHKIWFSAVLQSQRCNGGFGGSNCVRSGEPTLQMKFFEAPNCCTMRGAEGLFACGMHSLYRIGETLTLALPVAGRFTFADGAEVEVVSDYPASPAWRAQVLKAGEMPIRRIAGFTVPEGWREGESAGEVYPVQTRPAMAEGFTTLWRGPVMQGIDAQGALRPLNEMRQMERAQAEALSLTLLFPEQKQQI